MRKRTIRLMMQCVSSGIAHVTLARVGDGLR